ncbi:PAS domain-containing protein [Corynebacterium guangdongense]|uniref:PAS domain S-box-containing protein n=1 Tax=Corynebacterium guangdongense TaxID=1783348 RepID=A0ABU2A046_9CORY|nr:PAS domain S-box protein [Corynebacterium guangdongense]MDR7330559.1 PAS domain S-box-containing protein [Corynebacterium guangdongense]WJZ19113.1 Sensor protein FixL [Corynebacterium guangdongense]
MNDDEIMRELAPRIIEESTLDAIIYADRSGVIQLWNDAAVELFGYSTEEAVGQSLDLIVPEKHRKAHWTGWDRVMETGHTKYGKDPLSAPGMTKNGDRVSLEFAIVMLKDTGGRVEGVAAIMRDVSKRWERDRKMIEELRELKRERA